MSDSSGCGAPSTRINDACRDVVLTRSSRAFTTNVIRNRGFFLVGSRKYKCYLNPCVVAGLTV